MISRYKSALKMTSIHVRLDQLGTWVTPSRGLKSWSGTPFFTLFPHFTHEDETLVRSSLLHFFVCPQSTLDPHAFGAGGRHVSFWYKGSRQKFVLSPLGDQSWVSGPTPKVENHSGGTNEGPRKEPDSAAFVPRFRVNSA